MAPAGQRRWLEFMVGRQGRAELRKALLPGKRQVALNAGGEVVSMEVVHGAVLSFPDF